MIRINPKTKRWSFGITVRTSDGKSQRICGAPGVPGPYHDLPWTKAGALEAERRAISRATNASALDLAALKRVIDAFIASESTRGVTNRTIHNALTVLSRLIMFVTGEKLWLPHPSQTREPICAMDRADVERLLAACEDNRHRAVILLASEAGLRVREICELRWSDLGLAVRGPMNFKPRNVPVPPRLAETLAALPRLGRWIVSKVDGDKIEHRLLMRAINEICERAKVLRTPFLLHRLRLGFRASGGAKEGE